MGGSVSFSKGHQMDADCVTAGNIAAKGGKGSEKELEVSDRAFEQVKKFQERQGKQGKAFRLGIAAGGCSDYTYTMQFDDVHPEDLVVERDGVKVIVDQKSLEALRHSTLDFVSSLQQTGFVVHNPNLKHSCECGKSFS